MSGLHIQLPRAPGREVTFDGYRVPRVEVSEDVATGQWNLIYDRRFGVLAENLEELTRWVWIVAQAQAVGEGYSCHGENSVYRPNPHHVKVMEIAPLGPT